MLCPSGGTWVPTYLVERYWPGVTRAQILDALRRERDVIEAMSREGMRVRDVSCTLIPQEEVVFSVYDGPSATAIQQLNERAAFPISRIVEAITVAAGLDRRRPIWRGQRVRGSLIRGIP
jgi:hypothetical protein